MGDTGWVGWVGWGGGVGWVGWGVGVGVGWVGVGVGVGGWGGGGGGGGGDGVRVCRNAREGAGITWRRGEPGRVMTERTCRPCNVPAGCAGCCCSLPLLLLLGCRVAAGSEGTTERCRCTVDVAAAAGRARERRPVRSERRACCRPSCGAPIRAVIG